jgi:hypothetical protein
VPFSNARLEDFICAVAHNYDDMESIECGLVLRKFSSWVWKDKRKNME